MIAKSVLAITALAGAAYAATGETVTASGLAVTTINDEDGIGAGVDSYTFYQGDGTTADGWPSTDDWVSFSEMFEANTASMLVGCAQYGVTDDSTDEIDNIQTAIEAIAAETYVDHRFILAIIMQESTGCVRAPSSIGSVTNPGLMQDHDGASTCNDGSTVQSPCPESEIEGMISEGTAGTETGDGLANCLNEANATGAEAFYRAARIYNSGSVDASGDLGVGVGTPCYASDIANRLTGWVSAASSCTL
ncbi:uncharacterized protein BHQ10_003275 [Talaromyces amestolkiae]|uniref:Transglycosylase SLT domain-containing protein n=1 Tax=Talaromyces amestolkiae TaxID=1196081 RepID=A0A364KUP8_TALAM|nr:uncharacterized protein BHQ10_003275 [Talaromyces amestolkiae]RAO67263.1 hypothetical protein BHQ10_003275 [Talaromyces amestolkiae]